MTFWKRQLYRVPFCVAGACPSTPLPDLLSIGRATETSLRPPKPSHSDVLPDMEGQQVQILKRLPQLRRLSQAVGRAVYLTHG